jgi:exodeoxyribonuclease VII large subunit
LRDGDQVLCQGEIDAYPRRGTYQLIVRKIEPVGEGALQRALRELQKRLAAEGLFDPRHKQSLPPMPQRIGLVTSPSGAAIHDFLQCAGRRWQRGEFWIFPVRVQGDGAAAEIAAAIDMANRLASPPDVLVVTRGGGSIEDLWSFNDEAVVRAIHASRIPVVSAVGHEIDVTLADLVADLRALTPTEAAELVLPAVDEVRRELDRYRQRMSRSLTVRVDQLRQRLDGLAQRRVLRSPWDVLDQRTRQVDELEQRGRRAAWQAVQRHRERLGATAARLDALSPLAVLARGYSVTQAAADGRIVHSSDQLNVGDAMIVRFAKGAATGRVEKLE